jgi:peptidoglycan/xylan/chitin deacetylase (PgdA/CDA1 family)
VSSVRKVVLNFHGLGDPHADVPAEERPYWLPVERFEKIIEMVADRRSRGDNIAITFDDGNRSDIEIGAPRLVMAGLKASFFILTGRIEDTRYISREDIAQLRDMGMEIGLHGRSHVDWRFLDESGRTAEIPKARAELADLVGAPVRAVGIPFGAYNRRVMSYLKRQGFDRIYTSDGGSARQGARVQPRFSLRADTGEADIVALLNGAEGLLRSARRGMRRFAKEHVV